MRDAVEEAMERATAPVADKGEGWETTAAVLAYEVSRLRAFIAAAAAEAEWRFRSASFACGKGEANHRLHPVGQWLRERAGVLR